MHKKMDGKIVVDRKNGLTKKYRIRVAGSKEYKTWETTIPAGVIEREARKKDMAVEEFIERYIIQWIYNSFSGLYLEFIPSDKNE